jgi:RNA recognition motif-containing protein
VSIFVGNLPFRAEQEDVAELFAPFGEVTSCALPLERDSGRKRGFAFVELADAASESRAIEALQGTELMGRPLRINRAEPRNGGGGGGGGGRGGGYGGGSGGGYARPAPERSSGASGWVDRSYGSEPDSFAEGRSRRRRSSGGSGGDAGVG